MMTIILKKTGFFCHSHDEHTGEVSNVKIKSPLFMFFQNNIKVDKKVTVKHLMDILIKDEIDIDINFFSSMKGYNLRPFYEEMQTEPKNKRDDISFLEIGWGSDYYRGERKGEKDEIMIYTNMSGVSKKKDELVFHALCHSPLNDWKHLPIVLNESLMVNDYTFKKMPGSDKMETTVMTIMDAKKEMTLYEFVSAFLEGITWHGSPEERNEYAEQIDDAVEHVPDVSESRASHSRHDKEVELQRAINDEDYEKAAILKKELDKMEE